MKTVYERENLRITKFDKEDVITTSVIVDPTELPQDTEIENAYNSYSSFNNFNKPSVGSWF